MPITSASGIDAAPRKQTLSSNYIDFTSAATEGWAQQYLPDLMAQEAEIYGKRTIAGFLAQVGAEEASASDRVIWSEQGRLHLAYKATNEDVSANIFTITADVDGNTVDGSSGNVHGIRIGDMVLVSNSSLTLRGYVSNVNATTATILPYADADFDLAGFGDTAGASAYRILVIGSEFEKRYGW